VPVHPLNRVDGLLIEPQQILSLIERYELTGDCLQNHCQDML
jgi:hypothetical protein